MLGAASDLKAVLARERLAGELKRRLESARAKDLAIIKQHCVEALDRCVSQTIKPKLSVY